MTFRQNWVNFHQYCGSNYVRVSSMQTSCSQFVYFLGVTPQGFECQAYRATLSNHVSCSLFPCHWPIVSYCIIAYNNLKGTIPDEIFTNLDSLEQLSIGTNALSGRLPSTVGLMRSIEKFDIRSTFISGPIPSEINLLPKLQDFYICTCFLLGRRACLLTVIAAEVLLYR